MTTASVGAQRLIVEECLKYVDQLQSVVTYLPIVEDGFPNVKSSASPCTLKL